MDENSKRFIHWASEIREILISEVFCFVSYVNAKLKSGQTLNKLHNPSCLQSCFSLHASCHDQFLFSNEIINEPGGKFTRKTVKPLLLAIVLGSETLKVVGCPEI